MYIKPTIFLLQIILGPFYNLSKAKVLLNKRYFPILQSVMKLVIETQPRGVSLP